MTSKELSKNGPHVLHVTNEEVALIEATMNLLLSDMFNFAKDATLSGLMKNISKKCNAALRSQE